jgi:hypothetical protein
VAHNILPTNALAKSYRSALARAVSPARVKKSSIIAFCVVIIIIFDVNDVNDDETSIPSFPSSSRIARDRPSLDASSLFNAPILVTRTVVVARIIVIGVVVNVVVIIRDASPPLVRVGYRRDGVARVTRGVPIVIIVVIVVIAVVAHCGYDAS